jgi:hypothetical protein
MQLASKRDEKYLNENELRPLSSIFLFAPSFKFYSAMLYYYTTGPRRAGHAAWRFIVIPILFLTIFTFVSCFAALRRALFRSPHGLR